jgi:RNA polymerase sigma-70 factor (ECF subfamily)
MEYEEAENLLQDILIKVYRNINEYDDRWSFSSWIYRIAHNTVIDYFRSHKSESGDISLDDEEYAHLVSTLSDGSSPDKNLRRSDVRSCVNKAITTLPQEYREVIVLRYLEERSYEEISDILRIPIGTASTLVNRGKKRLRETFEKFRCTP